MQFVALPHEDLFDLVLALPKDVGRKGKGDLVESVYNCQQLKDLPVLDTVIEEDFLDLLFKAQVHQTAGMVLDLLSVDFD